MDEGAKIANEQGHKCKVEEKAETICKKLDRIIELLELLTGEREYKSDETRSMGFRVW